MHGNGGKKQTPSPFTILMWWLEFFFEKSGRFCFHLPGCPIFGGAKLMQTKQLIDCSLS